MSLTDKLKIAGAIGITALVSGCDTIQYSSDPDEMSSGELLGTSLILKGAALNPNLTAGQAVGFGLLGQAAETGAVIQGQREAAREIGKGSARNKNRRGTYEEIQPDGSVRIYFSQDPETQRRVRDKIEEINSKIKDVKDTSLNSESRILGSRPNTKALVVMWFDDGDRTYDSTKDTIKIAPNDYFFSDSLIQSFVNVKFFSEKEVKPVLKDEKGNVVGEGKAEFVDSYVVKPNEEIEGITQWYSFGTFIPVQDLKKHLVEKGMLKEGTVKRFSMDLYITGESEPSFSHQIIIDFERPYSK